MSGVNLRQQYNTDWDKQESMYYDEGGIETFEILKAKLTPEQYEGFLLGNVIKYSTRLNHKGQMGSDAKKLKNYSIMLEEFVND